MARWLDTLPTTYKERLQRIEQAWSATKPALIEKKIEYAPLHAATRSESNSKHRLEVLKAFEK